MCRRVSASILAGRASGEGAVVQVMRDAKLLWTPRPLKAHLEDCLPAAGQFVYILTAADANGADTRQQPVQVVDADAAASQPVLVDAAPAIDTFAVSPEAVAVNECVTVSWNIGGDVKTIQILRDDAAIRTARTGDRLARIV